jgi:4'-phosphopantetheinyl transferase
LSNDHRLDSDLPPLGEHQVHLWPFSLQLHPARAEVTQAILSPDELTRASRFHFPEHSEKFIKARATLRLILARYLDQPPSAIKFRYPGSGKPELACGTLHFNISHSANHGLLAISHHEVGVDLEHIRPLPERDQIARAFFTPAEAAELGKLPATDRALAFYRCWTRKEALLKGWGCGITENLKSFAVSLEAHPPSILLECLPALRQNWTIQNITAPAGYVAALAVNSKSSATTLFDDELFNPSCI